MAKRDGEFTIKNPVSIALAIECAREHGKDSVKVYFNDGSRRTVKIASSALSEKSMLAELPIVSDGGEVENLTSDQLSKIVVL